MNEKELVENIKIEMENLEKVNDEMKDLLAKIGKEPTSIRNKGSNKYRR